MNNFDPAIHHRQSIRWKGHDYSDANLYFITICSLNKQHIFGTVRNEAMELNELGKEVQQQWLITPELRDHVHLHEYIIMPNHFHAIIEVSAHNSTNTKYRAQPCAPTLGQIIRGFKSAVSKHAGYTVWQRNYYEHVIRDHKEHRYIAYYIENNPSQWGKDKYNK